MQQIRAIFHKSDDGTFQAQLLEIDIAGTAPSEKEMIREIEYAIELEYQIARDRNHTPFASLFNPPDDLDAKWQKATVRKQHALNLPDKVIDALAIALRSLDRPTSIEYKLAA